MEKEKTRREKETEYFNTFLIVSKKNFFINVFDGITKKLFYVLYIECVVMMLLLR